MTTGRGSNVEAESVRFSSAGCFGVAREVGMSAERCSQFCYSFRPDTLRSSWRRAQSLARPAKSRAGETTKTNLHRNCRTSPWCGRRRTPPCSRPSAGRCRTTAHGVGGGRRMSGPSRQPRRARLQGFVPASGVIAPPGGMDRPPLPRFARPLRKIPRTKKVKVKALLSAGLNVK
jgi:hypothetical protein